MNVPVVAWASSGRGEFEWFYAKENAEAAYRGEIFNVTTLAQDNTDKIDGQLTELCAEATVKAGPLS